MLACDLPVMVPTADPAMAQTLAALTVAAMQPPPTLTLLPSDTPVPMLAPTGTLTPTSTFLPTASFTSTPVPPVISVSVDTNCRTGPGKNYDQVGSLLVGATAEVFAKDPSGEFWYIQNPDDSNGFCWVWGQYATITGDVIFLPIYTPPPSPTPLPDFQIVFLKVDSCSRWWLDFSIQNTSGVAFESINIVVKDTKTGASVSNTSDSFVNRKGCASPTDVALIKPGETVLLSGPGFNYDPVGHKITTTIKLCTDNNLKGTCTTKQITTRL
jgi:hypothetical protein